MLHTALAFLGKDLRDSLCSHSLLLILLGPVILAAMFSRLTDPSAVGTLNIGVCGYVDSGLVNCLRVSGACKLEFSDNWRGLCQDVKNGSLDLAVKIAPGFDEELYSDSYPVLDLYVSESSLVRSLTARDLVRTSLRQMAGQEMPADVRVNKVNAFEGGMNVAFLPVWMVFTCLGALSVTSLTFSEELENKTMEAVLLAPVNWAEILGGKLACGFLLAWGSTVLVWLAGHGGKADFVALLLLIGLGAWLFASIGVVLGLIVKSPSVCGVLNSLVYLIFIMPVTMADYNSTMKLISRFLPSWYLCDGFNKVMFAGATCSDIARDVVALVMASALFILVGAWALRRVRTRM
ncbi:MAG: ABC transporter permease [bacterium]|nr:ABC transporter permease [bacterium]